MSFAISDVYLIRVDFDNTYNDVPIFKNADAQYTYFNGRKISKQAEGSFTYVRQDSVIRYPACLDDIRQANYVMYRNSAFSNKWFYAFITNAEYKNDSTTWLHIETDVMQTWMFDYSIHKSFVEREHVDSDVPGEHTVPEQLETGDYMCYYKNRFDPLVPHHYIIASTVDLNDPEFSNVAGTQYNGIFSGVRYFLADYGEVVKAIVNLANAGKSDAITGIFVSPKILENSHKAESEDSYYQLKNSACEPISWSESGSGVANTKFRAFGDYIPKNKKLLSYPYIYMLMSNNAGGSAVYKYELFNMNKEDDEVCEFEIVGTPTPGYSIRLLPKNYNGIVTNSEEGLNMGKLPVCSWNTDVYTNWLTQNSVNIGTNVAAGAVQVVGGLAAAFTGIGIGPGAGMMLSGAQQIAGVVGEVYSHSLQPPQAEGNLNNGDVVFANGELTFTAYEMGIKEEYAKIIDDYFQMFGYKCNELKYPNKWHRKSWWYTKTIDVNIRGTVPMEDLLKIKSVYNNGATFWANGENIGLYLGNNEIYDHGV